MLYTRLPTEKELAGTGYTPADYQEEVEVWPENWPAVDLFCAMRGQWREGLSGPRGLDYGVLFQLLDRKGYTGDAWWAMFDDIVVMQSAALDAMRAQ